MKPLGYYTDYTPGDGGLLEEMENDWGSDFSALSDSQRWWIVQHIAIVLFETHPDSDIEYENDDDVRNFFDRMGELSRGNLKGLIKFLLDGLKS